MGPIESQPAAGAEVGFRSRNQESDSVSESGVRLRRRIQERNSGADSGADSGVGRVRIWCRTQETDSGDGCKVPGAWCPVPETNEANETNESTNARTKY